MILKLFLPPHATGTSTDVSRYAGHYEHVFEATTAGVTLQAPQLDINTVAAGGGSRLFFRSVICQHSKLVDVSKTFFRINLKVIIVAILTQWTALFFFFSDQGCLLLDQSLQVHIQDQLVTEKVTFGI